MNRNTLLIIGGLVFIVLALGVSYYNWHGYAPAQKNASEAAADQHVVSPQEQIPAAADLRNGTYLIDGDMITLHDGNASAPAAPGSATQKVTKYFGNEATGDLNGDGIADSAFILTQRTGGSGTFYYVAAALHTDNGYTGSSAVLLGDRVAPQTTQIQNGKITVNYADRAPGEPFSVQPSHAQSLTLQLNGQQLIHASSTIQ